MSAMCRIQLKNILMPMFGLSEIIDHLAMAHCVHLYGDVLRREDDP